MAKWADYLISAVHYDSEETHIEKVKEHEDKGETVGGASIVSRKDVVKKLKHGNTYITIYKDSDNKWKKGEDVHVVKIDGEEFIRTDKNQKKEDNLGELPEF